MVLPLACVTSDMPVASPISTKEYREMSIKPYEGSELTAEGCDA